MVFVKFYIDDKLQFTDYSEPYRYLWDHATFFRHTSNATAFDNAGNSAWDEILVWKFF